MNASISNGTTIGNCAVTAIGNYFGKWVSQEMAVRADQDPEPLHQMRVALRRLRSGLICFSPILSPGLCHQAPKLGKIGRVLGRLRDLDVLRQELTTNYLPLLPIPEQARLQEYLVRLAPMREKRSAQVLALLDSPNYINTRDKIGAWLEKPQLQESADFPIPDMIPTLLLPALKGLLLPDWNLITPKEVHDLRKQFKLTRYQLECFVPYFPEDLRQSLRHLRTAQDVLGFLHDRMVLTDVLSRQGWKHLSRLKEIIRQHQSEDWRTWYSLHHNLDWLQVLLQIRSLAPE